MKISFKWMLILVLMTVLTACNKEEPAEEVPELLDVQISIQPEQIAPSIPVTFEAKVTYGEEEVTDADKIVFEIWRANDENHEKIEVPHKEKGVYSLEKTFDREGTYYIYAHVTARSMHNMPKEEFIVGTASEPESDTNADSAVMEHEKEHANH